jgi:hypothetical protein
MSDPKRAAETPEIQADSSQEHGQAPTWQAPTLREVDARMTMSAAAIPNNDGSGENTSASS